jgi:hypothetical protein
MPTFYGFKTQNGSFYNIAKKREEELSLEILYKSTRKAMESLRNSAGYSIYSVINEVKLVPVVVSITESPESVPEDQIAKPLLHLAMVRARNELSKKFMITAPWWDPERVGTTGWLCLLAKDSYVIVAQTDIKFDNKYPNGANRVITDPESYALATLHGIIEQSISIPEAQSEFKKLSSEYYEELVEPYKDQPIVKP